MKMEKTNNNEDDFKPSYVLVESFEDEDQLESYVETNRISMGDVSVSFPKANCSHCVGGDEGGRHFMQVSFFKCKQQNHVNNDNNNEARMCFKTTRCLRTNSLRLYSSPNHFNN